MSFRIYFHVENILIISYKRYNVHYKSIHQVIQNMHIWSIHHFPFTFQYNFIQRFIWKTEIQLLTIYHWYRFYWKLNWIKCRMWPFRQPIYFFWEEYMLLSIPDKCICMFTFKLQVYLQRNNSILEGAWELQFCKHCGIKIN